MTAVRAVLSAALRRYQECAAAASRQHNLVNRLTGHILIPRIIRSFAAGACASIACRIGRAGYTEEYALSSLDTPLNAGTGCLART